MAGKKNTKQLLFDYDSFTLKVIAMVMMMIGTVGVSIIQNGILDMGALNIETLAEVLGRENVSFWLITALFLCGGIMALALPIHAYLLVEGYKKTSSVAKYALRIFLLALVSEVPYDLAMQGSWFTMNSQNPVWGVLIAFIIIYFLKYFENIKKVKGVLLKLLIVLAGVIWAGMLNVNYGVGFVLAASVFWLFEDRGTLKTILAGIATLFYFPAPLGMAFNYLCNEEKGRDGRILFYIVYPVQLLVFGLIGKFLL